MTPGKWLRRRAGRVSLAALSAACAVAASAVASGGDASTLQRAGAGAAASYVPGEAIVRFEPGTSRDERREVRKDAGVAHDRSLGLPRAELVEVEGSVRDAVRRLERQPGVAYAQPNYRYRALAVEPPDDTFFEELWGLDDPAMPNPGVGVLDAWDKTQGAGQVIAVLDTGVDLTHPDLQENLWDDPTEPGLDDHGFDFVDDDADPDDYQFHGTHVAGTAAAIADDNLGIAGVAPEAEIMAVRVLDGDGFGDTAQIADGIEYAAGHGASVINMSLGGLADGGAEDKMMSDAIAVAGAAGTVVVAAAGNEAADNDVEPHTPCALPNPNLICVAAINQGGSLASFSNWGEESVDIAAPGTSILSTKTDYGPPLFEDGFEAGLGLWTTQASGGGKLWGESSSAASGSKSATDSPGGNYAQASLFDEAFSELLTTGGTSLSGQRGCRIHFRTKYQIEVFFDAFFAGAIEGAGSLSAAFEGTGTLDGFGLDGTSPGFPSQFLREEVSISALDGQTGVSPIFGVISDESVELDGAYVDDVRLICRDETYEDKIVAQGSEYDLPSSGNYVAFNGTSMATPHVAGVVALVRAAEPGLSVQQVIDAVLDGASAIPSIVKGKRTATEGIADACKAIALATGGNVEAECPASSDPMPQPPPEEGGGGGTPADGTSSASGPPATATPRAKRAARPQTFFKRRPPAVVLTDGRRALAVFRFGANAKGVTFRCSVDRRPFRRCAARFVRRYGLGPHLVKVKARDATGHVDRTPAVARFRVEQRG